jgi:hypothetical protein
MSAPKLTGNRCRCSACGDYFNSTSTFDRHRAGTFAARGTGSHARRCLTADELRAKGWARNAAGFWIERPRKASTTRVEAAAPTGGGSAVEGASREAA